MNLGDYISLEDDVSQKIRNLDKKCKNPKEQAKVLMVARELGAFDKNTAARTRQFLDKGVKGSALQRSKQNNLMEKSKTFSTTRFIMDERQRSWLTLDEEIKKALDRERDILYKEILSNPTIRNVSIRSLRIPQNATLEDIRSELETGNLRYSQVSKFDELVFDIHLTVGARNTECKRIGWRTAPHYWNLTDSGKKLLEGIENA